MYVGVARGKKISKGKKKATSFRDADVSTNEKVLELPSSNGSLDEVQVLQS